MWPLKQLRDRRERHAAWKQEREQTALLEEEARQQVIAKAAAKGISRMSVGVYKPGRMGYEAFRELIAIKRSARPYELLLSLRTIRERVKAERSGLHVSWEAVYPAEPSGQFVVARATNPRYKEELAEHETRLQEAVREGKLSPIPTEDEIRATLRKKLEPKHLEWEAIPASEWKERVTKNGGICVACRGERWIHIPGGCYDLDPEDSHPTYVPCTACHETGVMDAASLRRYWEPPTEPAGMDVGSESAMARFTHALQLSRLQSEDVLLMRPTQLAEVLIRIVPEAAFPLENNDVGGQVERVMRREYRISSSENGRFRD